MPRLSLDELVRRANQRLKDQKFKPRIQVRGNRLVLRATFPPRPGSTKLSSHQQRMPTGFSATPAGVGEAEKLAKVIDFELSSGSFKWETYTGSDSPQTVAEWLVLAEKEYFSSRLRSPKSETTWDVDYRHPIQRLPQDKSLSCELLTETLTTKTAPDSRSRKRYALAYNWLARLAGIECELKKYSGSWSPSSVNPQDVPTDEEIIKVWRSVEEDDWKWAIGILAAYGIRPSELTYCTVEESGILDVSDGKTGQRRVWPLYPEWVKDFRLLDARMPEITGATNTKKVAPIHALLKRYNSPFTAKAPRKAWAVRAILCDLPVELAAYQQGHSVAVHTKMYSRWISDESQQRVYDKIMSREDRPKPPVIS